MRLFSHPLTKNGNTYQPFHGVIRIAYNAGAEEKPFYIVAPVEFDGEVYQFAYRKCGTGNVIASSIDTIGTVIYAIIGQHNFQQGYATTVLGEAVAYSPAAYGVSQCA